MANVGVPTRFSGSNAGFGVFSMTAGPQAIDYSQMASQYLLAAGASDSDPFYLALTATYATAAEAQQALQLCGENTTLVGPMTLGATALTFDAPKDVGSGLVFFGLSVRGYQTALRPSGGSWGVFSTSQSGTSPNRADVSLAYTPLAQPNPIVRYSDLFTHFGALGDFDVPCVFPGTKLEALVELFRTGTTTPEAIAALGGVLRIGDGFAVPHDTYFDVSAALVGSPTSQPTVSLSVSSEPELVEQHGCSASFYIPGQYLTKINAFSGVPYRAASNSVATPWAAFARLLRDGHPLKALLERTYATQHEFDRMQVENGWNAQALGGSADSPSASHYWGLTVGGYTLPQPGNGQQTSPGGFVRISIAHSIIQ